MKILIIGGTLFVGRHYVNVALANNHDVTIMHRGRLKTEKVEGVTEVIGDRETDLDKLPDCHWDVVIDTCCYVPRVMRSTLAALKDRIGMYLMISSISVYKMNGDFYIDEDSEVKDLLEEKPDDKNEETMGYGENKLASEMVLQQALPDHHLIIRPGLITGPYDVSCRITYWLERFAQAGQVLTFGKADAPVQWIDARDMCEWSFKMAEQGQGGVFNMVGPQQTYTAAQFYQCCANIAGTDIKMFYLPAEFCQQIKKWHMAPGALGLSWQGHECISKVKNDKAVKLGLTFRSPVDTFKQTFEWSAKWDHDYHFKVSGMESLHKTVEQALAIEQDIWQQYQAWVTENQSQEAVV